LSSLAGFLTVALRLYDTAFDRSAPVSPDHILGKDATPVSLSETVLPDAHAGFLDKRLSDFPTFLDFSIPAGVFIRAFQVQSSVLVE